MRREEKGRKHGALVESGGKRRGGDMRREEKRRKREELGVRRVGRAGRERGGELKRRREGGGEVVRGGRMCRCAKREERGGVCGATAGLRCGEANPNQWDGVEPSHWGGPQG